MTEAIFFEPVFKETIWGGNRLHSVYGYAIPSDHTGECWAISAHPNGDCKIANGPYQGKTLSWLWQHHRELFGDLKGDVFPLLIKYIDAHDDLSVQVHPDDDYAGKYERSLGKNECWYVLDCEKHTRMVMGHSASSKAEAEKLIETEDYAHFLHFIDIKPGDFYSIPAGTIHAICGGSLIYEVQQSSDITYRVYDYDRTDVNGNRRALHVKQSLDVLKIPGDVPSIMKKEYPFSGGTEIIYLETPDFHVSRIVMDGQADFTNEEPMILLSVIAGDGYLDSTKLQKGMNLMIPSAMKTFRLSGQMQLMKTIVGRKLK